MAALFHPGDGPVRGSTTAPTPRLFDLMAGATVAFLAASRRQPNARARRTLHGWARRRRRCSGCSGCSRARPAACRPTSCSKAGSCSAPRWRRLVVADARLIEPGRFARGLAWRPLHFVGTISYGIYLWHWPVIVYLNGARTGLSTWPLDLLRIAVTLALSTASYYLVERPIRLARFRGGPGTGDPSPGSRRRWSSWWPPSRRRRSQQRRRHHAPAGFQLAGRRCPGAGGYAGQQPIRLAPPPSPADPLRVMILGDSVMHDASYGITAALEADGRGHRRHADHRRLRADDGDQLADVHPEPHPPDRAQLIVASWSWDQYGPTTPNALHQPVQYTRLLRRAVATHAGARQRRRGGDLHRSSPSRASSPRPTRPTRRATTESAGPASSPGTPSPKT